MDYMSNFSETLSELMQEENIKSDELGKIIGVSGSAIRRWIRCDGDINLTNILKIADFFNCSLEFLIGKTDKRLDYLPKELIPFPQRLREVLKSRDKTRYFLNKNTRFKDGYFYMWDKGKLPNLITLIDLAEILECTVDFLVGRER